MLARAVRSSRRTLPRASTTLASPHASQNVSSVDKMLLKPLARTPLPILPSQTLLVQNERKHSPLQVRLFHQGRSPWPPRDWRDTVKTGALVAAGAGAVVVASSFAFGFIIVGAAGYGIYTLYQRFFGPFGRFRSRPSDPFGSIFSDIDQMRRRYGGTNTATRRASASSGNELDNMLQGLPFMVRGVAKTIFSFVGKEMNASLQRAADLSQQINDALQSNRHIQDQYGDVYVSGPQGWSESSVNGVAKIESTFPVEGAPAVVKLKASTDSSGNLSIQKLTYKDRRSGTSIDLLQSSGSGRKRTVIDAEYVDVDDFKRH